MFETLDQALNAYYLEHDTYEGASPETLNIDIPELHHFQFEVGSPAVYKDYFESGVLQSGSLSWGMNGGIWGKRVTAHSPEGLTVSGYWASGKLLGLSCLNNGKHISCAEYFNCDAEPIVLDQVGTGWQGGTCRLK